MLMTFLNVYCRSQIEVVCHCDRFLCYRGAVLTFELSDLQDRETTPLCRDALLTATEAGIEKLVGCLCL
jgi:hypothetical protein